MPASFSSSAPGTAPETVAFTRHLASLKERDWVVYAKAPFAVPEQVLDYVGRYHRVAISIMARHQAIGSGFERKTIAEATRSKR